MPYRELQGASVDELKEKISNLESELEDIKKVPKYLKAIRFVGKGFSSSWRGFKVWWHWHAELVFILFVLLLVGSILGVAIVGSVKEESKRWQQTTEWIHQTFGEHSLHRCEKNKNAEHHYCVIGYPESLDKAVGVCYYKQNRCEVLSVRYGDEKPSDKLKILQQRNKAGFSKAD